MDKKEEFGDEGWKQGTACATETTVAKQSNPQTCMQIKSSKETNRYTTKIINGGAYEATPSPFWVSESPPIVLGHITARILVHCLAQMWPLHWILFPHRISRSIMSTTWTHNFFFFFPPSFAAFTLTNAPQDAFVRGLHCAVGFVSTKCGKFDAFSCCLLLHSEWSDIKQVQKG